MARWGLNRQDLQQEVNEYLYGGSGGPTVDSDAEDVVNRVIDSGLRQFYNPPPVNGYVHDWSFLKPVTKTTLQAPFSTGKVIYDHAGGTPDNKVVSGSGDDATGAFPSWASGGGLLDLEGTSYPIIAVAGDGSHMQLDSSANPGADVGDPSVLTTGKAYKIPKDDYDLPVDFSRIVGNITFSEKDNAWHTVRIVGEARIRELRQRDYAASSSTDPTLAAISPKNTLATSSTGGAKTHTIQFWPAITSSAVIHYRYEVRPQALSAAGDYPYGADDHSDTILYSCLSAAERRLDREVGPYKMRFMEALASSIEKDGRANRPELLGYNSDQSDGFDPDHTRIYGGRIRHKQQDGTFLE